MDDVEVERAGSLWAERSDSYLVGDAFRSSHANAVVEMQRRLVVAIRDFNRSASEQARTMIRLTWAIIGLTVVLGVIAGMQLWAMLVKGT